MKKLNKNFGVNSDTVETMACILSCGCTCQSTGCGCNTISDYAGLSGRVYASTAASALKVVTGNFDYNLVQYDGMA